MTHYNVKLTADEISLLAEAVKRLGDAIYNQAEIMENDGRIEEARAAFDKIPALDKLADFFDFFDFGGGAGLLPTMATRQACSCLVSSLEG